MKPLTKHQEENFAKDLHRLGLTTESFAKQNKILKELYGKKKNIVFSSDPFASDVPPIIIAVGSIQDMKDKVGVPDSMDDSGISYPPPPNNTEMDLLKKVKSKAELLAMMDKSFSENIQKASSAFVLGDSRKVKEYEDLINAIMFPGEVAVFGGDNLIVPDGQTHTITGPDPVKLTYGEISVGVGSQILVETDANITSQNFIQNS